MLNDHQRLARLVENPAIVRLARALSRLSSVLTFVNSGAHPDDEQNGMLAALRFGLGIHTIVVCSTRGEGGQNAIGPERLAALAALRTREMEVAAARIDADVTWVGHGPNDPVHDFGFSKDGDDTLARWGEDRIVERMVLAYRTDRPDIVTPTFLDVPGQHGHHRAMTRAAFTAIALAADPTAYPEHFAQGLTPWQVAKFYLPAWSGAGSSYDDEVPPPPATLVFEVGGADPVTGASWGQLGQWSRAAHACQGMGRWVEPAQDRWPLHLKWNSLGISEPESDIRTGLPATVGALASLPDLPTAAVTALGDAQTAIDQAQAAFPDRSAIRRHAAVAMTAIELALSCLTAPLDTLIGHRLRRKSRELQVVLAEAAQISAHASASGRLVPGGTVEVTAVAQSPDLAGVTSEVRLRADLTATRLGSDGATSRFSIAAPQDAGFTSTYPATFDAMGGNGDASVRVTAIIENRPCHVDLDLDEALRIVPAHSVTVEPDSVLLDPRHPTPADVRLVVSGGAAATLDLPAGWTAETIAPDAFRLTPPAPLNEGLIAIHPRLASGWASRETDIAYEHIGVVPFIRSAPLRILSAQINIPEGVRIGYIGGSNDSVGIWLRRLGLAVTDLDAATFAGADLSAFTSIVVGIFAFGTRPDLAAGTSRLHGFVEAGGHLLTLYHRPSDGWNPGLTPPRRIEIGQPSLRWRVTNPDAPVTMLEPDHPLLAGPNRIESDDWAGWQKERGLYFASRWDPAYVPLLAMHDAGEQPLNGSLLSARIGKGRHTHTSLVLHQQLDALVPGAFRLIANLVQMA